MKVIVLLVCILLAFSSCDTASTQQATSIDTSIVTETPVQPEFGEELEDSQGTVTPEEVESPKEPAPNPRNDDYFNDTLFVGDSIMEGIRQYVAKARKEGIVLGDAKFVTTTVGITIAHLTGHINDDIYYTYKGEEAPIEDILISISPKRVFFLLGLNDLAMGIDNQLTAERYFELINNTKKLLPNTEVIIIANPPKVNSSWLPTYVKNKEFDNDLISDFVEKIRSICDDCNVEFVDIHASLCNDKGALDDSMCRDGYVHLNDEGARVVVDTLYKFAEYK